MGRGAISGIIFSIESATEGRDKSSMIDASETATLVTVCTGCAENLTGEALAMFTRGMAGLRATEVAECWPLEIVTVGRFVVVVEAPAVPGFLAAVGCALLADVAPGAVLDRTAAGTGCFDLPTIVVFDGFAVEVARFIPKAAVLVAEEAFCRWALVAPCV